MRATDIQHKAIKSSCPLSGGVSRGERTVAMPRSLDRDHGGSPPAPHATPRTPASRALTQGWTWQARAVLAITFLSGWLALALPPAHADVTYTWHTDSGDSVAGSFTLVSAALTNPANLTAADFTSIAFTATITGSEVFAIFGSSDNLGFNSNGDPVTSTYPNLIGFDHPVAGVPFPDDMYFNLDAKWNTVGGEQVASDSSSLAGTGHWIITNTAVPEPSTAALAVTGALTMMGYDWIRRRRARRRR
jgi:hypothetical protein